MGQQDPQAHCDLWYINFKVGNNVDDGQRQPAQCKQEENQEQGLGCLELPSVKRTCLSEARQVLTEFLAEDVEDVQIDDAHDNEGDEDPGDETEEDHVIQTHDRTEMARKGGHILGEP